MADEKNKSYILDSSVFLRGIDFNLFPGRIYTTPAILDEIKVKRYEQKNRTIMSRIDAALESKQLTLLTPSEEYLAKIESAARETGDLGALSPADQGLVALALELNQERNERAILYTNDYSMENLCSELGLPFSPLHRDGIKKKIKWEVYCPNCGTTHEPGDFGNTCERCGIRLKRRPRTK